MTSENELKASLSVNGRNTLWSKSSVKQPETATFIDEAQKTMSEKVWALWLTDELYTQFMFL